MTDERVRNVTRLRSRHSWAMALAIPAILAMSACAGTASAGQAEKSGAIVRNGSLTLGTNGQEPPCIAPAENAGLNGPELSRPLTDSVVYENPKTHELEPWLATKWAVSADGLTYTFTLRKGVTFSDGTPWNAEAFKANLDYIVDPATKSPMSASYIAPYESSTVVDPYSLTVKLSTPYSAFLRVLAQGFFGMVSPKQIADAPADICAAPIGTGPFTLVKWTKGQSVEYVRNDAYNWGPPGTHTGAAYLKHYTVLFLGEDSTRYNALASGQVDVVDWVPAQNIHAARQDPSLSVLSLTTPGHPFSWWLNTARAPFNDLKVRQALLTGIDRAEIVNSVLFGEYKTATGYLTSSTLDYSKNTIAHSVKKANALLDEAGWGTRDSDGYRTKDGKRLTAQLPTSNAIAYRVQIAEQVQAQAKKLGIDIEISYPTSQELSQDALDGNYDISAGIWGTNTPDILWLRYSSKNITTADRIGLNVARLRDDTVDSLLQQARETTDAAQQAALYGKAQTRLIDLAPAIPFFDDQRVVAFDTAKVHGLSLETAYPAPYVFDAWTSEG
ncbi:ABC transporter substrate-binding protein [Microbacterium sp. STN6]|uniref:ABC transporter substrate-binding protein n=1 Tax=Microbacterium sp. STN6 TaxID=2995588 RepID=UPI00226103EA|nr:ABC transporter substrate-binding protein [Microbacterium sp. STN6]MCX7521435.1 ABC transporter substrate-binding protein [Microbacterium sp. STN6]